MKTKPFFFLLVVLLSTMVLITPSGLAQQVISSHALDNKTVSEPKAVEADSIRVGEYLLFLRANEAIVNQDELYSNALESQIVRTSQEVQDDYEIAPGVNDNDLMLGLTSSEMTAYFNWTGTSVEAKASPLMMFGGDIEEPEKKSEPNIGSHGEDSRVTQPTTGTSVATTERDTGLLNVKENTDETRSSSAASSHLALEALPSAVLVKKNSVLKSNLSMIKIALVGDYNERVPAHQGISKALQMAATELGVRLEFKWISTDSIKEDSCLASFNGIWCVPGSPYINRDGALLAIHYAREQEIPFLGTCGGFQHAIMEYTRNVIGWENAEHAEEAPDAEQLVISRLACSLVKIQKPIALIPGTKIAETYGVTSITEGYYCNYGFNPIFEETIIADSKSSLQISARDDTNEVRAVELTNHPFFIATLFQHELAALKDQLSPLVVAFVKALI